MTEQRVQRYRKKMPKFYALVVEMFGPERAPELFLNFLDESAEMDGGDQVRPSYAYVALRRYQRAYEEDKGA